MSEAEKIHAELSRLGLADMIVNSRVSRGGGPTVVTVALQRWHDRGALIAAMQRLSTLPGTESAWVNGGVIHLARR